MSTVETTRRPARTHDRASRAAPAEPYRPPYGAAGLVTLAVFALYAFTLAPTTAFWDTSEYIATAHILGIPHPPGNPLFVVLARAWELILAPLGLSVAVRVNLFSAVMGALAHGFWFLLVHRILVFFSEDRKFRLIGAAAAVLVSASAFTVWNQSNVNEKVYTVSLFTIALLSWLAFRWRDRLGEGKDDNLLLLMAFILALSVGNHLMAFLVAPALVLFILFVHPSTLWNWRLYALAVPAGILGLSIHLFLPLRAGLSPVINEADPTCESTGAALQSIVTMGRTGCDELSAALSRKQYDKPSITENPLDPSLPRDAHLLTRQLLNYAQYFDWQWARSLAGNLSWFGGMRPMITLLFGMLGLMGAWVHWERDRVSWAYVATLFATLSFGLTFYMNFRYGYTLPESLMRRDFIAAVGSARDLTEVRERDYFFIVSFSVWGLWAGIGLAAIWDQLRDRFVRTGRARAALLASPVMALAFIPLFANFSWAGRAGDYTARDWAFNLLQSIEPYGILFTNGDNDTFPLWYLQEVEGIRRDVTVMVMSYLNTPWYVRQIRDLTRPCEPGEDPLANPTLILCQRPFEPDRAPAFYSAGTTPADQPGVPLGQPDAFGVPTRSIVPLSDEEILQIANTPPYLLQQARSYDAGDLRSDLPANSVIIPSDLFLGSIIRTAIEDRPIYFAMTTQAYEELALRPYLIRQGVAFKLNNGPVVADSVRGILPTPPSQIGAFTGPWIDLPRTEALVSDVFVHRGGFPVTWGHWVDSATEGIPFYYGYTHYGLAEVYSSIGRSEDAERHAARANEFFRLGSTREVARQQ
ncbi:MAG: glycosyltransferase family 117 protein [Longimicrobiales bacterium]